MNKKIKLFEVKKVTSVKEMLNLAAKEDGDKIAFEYKDEKEKGKIVKITYNEFKKDTESLGTALANVGMQDKHIAMIGENSYKWLTVYLTVLQSTGVFVPIDKELTVNDVINILEHGECEVLFYAPKYEKWIEQIKEEVPNIKYFIGLERENDEENILSYEKFKETGKKLLEEGSTKYTSLQDDEYKLKLLVYTSGTTGNPKGVMLTEHNLMSVVYYGLQVAEIQTRCLSVLPYHHTYESVVGILVAIHKRATICINDSLKNVLKNLQLYKPDYIYLVPAFTEVFYKNIWANAKKTGKDKVLKIIIPFLLVPLALAIGIFVLEEKSYTFISIAVSILALVLFISGFEKKKTGTRRLVIVSVMPSSYTRLSASISFFFCASVRSVTM